MTLDFQFTAQILFGSVEDFYVENSLILILLVKELFIRLDQLSE